MHSQWSLVALEQFGEFQIRGRVVGRIAADNDEQIHLTASMSATNSLSDSVWLIGLASTGFGVEHSLADVAELCVHRMRDGVNHGTLVIARNHQARSAPRLQVFRNGGKNLAVSGGPLDPSPPDRSALANASISAARTGHR